MVRHRSDKADTVVRFYRTVQMGGFMGYKDPDKQREYQRNWMALRRSEYMSKATCFMCGSEYGLELDHRVPGEKVSHRIWSWSRERIDREIAKCDWLCRECHQIKTLLMDTNMAIHGTHSGYTSGCRCEGCKSGHAETMKGWRDNARGLSSARQSADLASQKSGVRLT